MTSIRVKAMLVALDGSGTHHLVARHAPSQENPDGFHRLVGGGVEQGETHRAAVEREVAEELGAEVRGLRHVATLENIFRLDGEPGHEVVLVWSGRLDPAPPAGGTLTESSGDVLPVEWRPVADEGERLPLYPDGAGEVVRLAAARHVHHVLDLDGRRFTVTRATEDDVPALVALLADDPLGAAREGGDPAAYLRAFRDLDADPQQLLVAVRDEHDVVVGTLQLTLVPGLARQGATRLQVEAVRLADETRGRGLGRALFGWAHGHGRARGATLAQLTTNKSRGDAHRFYESLGYAATHEGYKRPL